MAQDKKDSLIGSLIGLAVGDALGTTLEFSSPGEFEPINDIVGGGPFNLKPGQWTDDTSMALCLAESLIEKKGFDAKDQMNKYVDWYKNGHNSVKGHCFDIGYSTQSALDWFIRNGKRFAYYPDTENAGNGALMRLAPIIIMYHKDYIDVSKMAAESSKTTHNSPQSIQSCRMMALIVSMLTKGVDKEDVFKPIVWPTLDFGDSVVPVPLPELITGGIQSGESTHEDVEHYLTDVRTDGILSLVDKQHPVREDGSLNLQEHSVLGSGYCPMTLQSALWAFYRTDNFKDGALEVVNLGGDSDTTGAVYGQIAGSHYGLSGIPQDWVDKIWDIDRIVDYGEKLYNMSI